MEDYDSDQEPDVIGEFTELLKNSEKYCEGKAAALAVEAKAYADSKSKEIEDKTEASIGDLAKKVKELTDRLGRVEEENQRLRSTCHCGGLLECLMDAGKSYLSTTSNSNEDLSWDTGTTATVDLTVGSGTSLLTYTEPTRNDDSGLIVPICSTPRVFLGGRVNSTATTQLYTEIDDLPEDLPEKVRAFHKVKSVHCTNYRMSDQQRVYLRYKMEEHANIKRVSLRAALVFKDGLRDRIWPGDHEKYVKMRVKNYINSCKLLAYKKDHAQRHSDSQCT